MFRVVCHRLNSRRPKRTRPSGHNYGVSLPRIAKFLKGSCKLFLFLFTADASMRRATTIGETATGIQLFIRRSLKDPASPLPVPLPVAYSAKKSQ